MKKTHNFIAKKNLFSYTHEYYLGWFQTTEKLKWIHTMKKINPNITPEYFSLKLYEVCLKNNIKPNKHTAEYLLLKEWRKLKQTPNVLKNTQIIELKKWHTQAKNNIPIENEVDTIITTLAQRELIKEINDFIEQNFSKQQKEIYNLYFIENRTSTEITEIMTIQKSRIYQIVNCIKEKLKEKFGNKYLEIKKD